MAIDTLQETAMEATLDHIKKRVRSLSKKRKHILQIEENLNKGKALEKQQQEVLQSKPSVLARIDLLDKLSKEISSSLNSRYKELVMNPSPVHASTTDESAPATRSQAEVATAQSLTFGSFQVPVHDIKPKNQDNTSINDKERYLCISDGFSIYCLDLKQSKNQPNDNRDAPPPLPKLSTINLAVKGLPILLGLFKVGSNAYTIGGRAFPALENDAHDWFMGIFDSMSKIPGLNGTSCVPYRLSLADGRLSLSECSSIKPLDKPICWPVVEKVGDEVHAMEFLPTDLFRFHITRMAKHVVLDLNDLPSGWVKIPHMVFECMSNSEGARMWAHLVLGNTMYAKAESHRDKRTLIFDFKNRAWDVLGRGVGKCDDLSLIHHVAQIFDFGWGIRRVGEFLQGELGDTLYVVFAIVMDRGCVFAVVYLVDYNGYILAFQEVPHFFDEVTRPASVIECIVIKEEKLMCAIIRGKPSSHLATSECLFVYTFSVEEPSDARLWIRDFWKVRAGGRSGEAADMQDDFVRVVVKGRYVYTRNAQPQSHGDRISRMQACFL